MKRVESHGVLMLVCLAGSMMSSLGVARADEFNDERLRAGQDAYVAKRYLEAIDQFRIAAFGSLDKPVVLDECLVRLALAQAAADKGADVRATLERFLEVESRFGGYAQARLQPEIRSAFRALLVSRVPQATILSIPSLAGLIETEEQKIARLPAAERRKALEAASKREPGSVVWMIALSRDALGQGDTRDADRWASKALATQPDNPDALALRARARAARGECVDALKDLAALTADQRTSRPELSADSFVCFVEVHNFDAAVEVSGRIPDNLASRPDVVQAKARLTSEQQRRAGGVAAASKAAGPKAAAPAPAASTTAGKAAEPPTPDPARTQVSLADARRLIATGKSQDAEKVLAAALKTDPGSRELRLELLEAACLSRSYQTAVAQIAVVKPFDDAESPSIFYAAVALYETGKADEARQYLQKALPRVSGALVDEYSKKILGTGGPQ